MHPRQPRACSPPSGESTRTHRRSALSHRAPRYYNQNLLKNSLSMYMERKGSLWRKLHRSRCNKINKHAKAASLGSANKNHIRFMAPRCHLPTRRRQRRKDHAVGPRAPWPIWTSSVHVLSPSYISTAQQRRNLGRQTCERTCLQLDP